MNAPVLSRIAGRADPAHAELANAIRFLAIDAVEQAKSGHPGMPMGMADVASFHERIEPMFENSDAPLFARRGLFR